MFGVFYAISYMNENSILLSYYIYFILVLEFMWFIQKKEFALFNFLGARFFFCKSGYCRENQPVIGIVIT